MGRDRTQKIPVNALMEKPFNSESIVAKGEGWIEVAQSWIGNHPPSERNRIRKLLLDARMSSWKFTLPSIQHNRVLLLGDRFYSIALSFSKTSKFVVVYGVCAERVDLASRMNRSSRIDNIQSVLGKSFLNIPFSSNTFDLVIVNGVLHSEREFKIGASHDRQRQCLHEVNRVLKPEGTCYLGVKNRFRYNRGFYPPGPIKDNRLDLIAKFYYSEAKTFLLGISDSRDPLQSLSGYEHLLDEAGFTGKRVFSIVPGWDHLSKVSTLEHPFVRQQKDALGFKNKIKNYMDNSRLFAPAFGIVATSNCPGESLYKKIWQHILNKLVALDPDFKNLCLPTSYDMRGTQTVTMISKYKHGDGGVVVRFPLSPTADKRRRRAHEVLKEIRHVGPQVAEMVNKLPTSLLEGDFGGVSYYVETLVKGKPVNCAEMGLTVDAFYEEAAGLISRFHEATATVVDMDETQYERTFGNLMKKLALFIPEPFARKRIEYLSEWVASLIQGSRLPLVCAHGDYKLDNCLVDDNYVITGVIDWELSRFRGLPMLDLFHLWASRRRFVENKPLVESISSLLNDVKEGRNLDVIFCPYIEQWEISTSQLISLTIAYWARYIVYNIEPLRFTDPDWIKAVYYDTLDVIEECHKRETGVHSRFVEKK